MVWMALSSSARWGALATAADELNLGQAIATAKTSVFGACARRLVMKRVGGVTP